MTSTSDLDINFNKPSPFSDSYNNRDFAKYLKN